MKAAYFVEVDYDTEDAVSGLLDVKSLLETGLRNRKLLIHQKHKRTKIHDFSVRRILNQFPVKG
jgi:hypothetical protein